MVIIRHFGALREVIWLFRFCCKRIANPDISADIPVLLLKAELDPIVPMNDAVNFLNALVSEDKSFIVVQGHGHDMLLEKKPQKVQKKFFLWLKAH